MTRPLLGSFATKNAAYGMIARNFARGEAPLWRPTVDVLANGKPGGHLLEVPLSAYLAGGGWRVLGGSLDIWGRSSSIFFSALAAALLVCLGTRWFGKQAGLGAGVAFALCPVSIIYGQSFMLEASVACLAALSVWALDVWLARQRRVWLLICGLSLTALMLSKIYMLILLWPIAWLAYRGSRGVAHDHHATDANAEAGREQRGTRSRLLSVGITSAIACLPACAWLAYVFAVSGNKESASHLFYSLRDSTQAHAWPPPILRSPDFYQHLFDDVMGVVLTPVGFVLALLGLATRRWTMLIPWLGSSLILLLVLPLKFHEMNYYFVPVLPPGCLLIGLGWQNLSERGVFRGRLWRCAFLIVAIVLAARYTVRPAFLTPVEDQAVVAAAESARELTTHDDLIATLHGTSIDLLYYCDRKGWALSVNDPRLLESVAQAAEGGARCLVVANLDGLPESKLAELRARYATMRETASFAIFELAPGPSELAGPEIP